VKAILLGYEFWQRAFGGDKQIMEDGAHQPTGVSPTVIGVMEPGVRFLPLARTAKEPNYDVNATVDFWVPAENRSQISESSELECGRRLRDGATPPRHTRAGVLAANEAQTGKQFEGFVPKSSR